MSSPNQNQFAQGVILGMADLRMNTHTLGCQVDSGQSTPLVAGQTVKIVDSAGGVPKVVAVAADTDIIFGVVNYNPKNAAFPAGLALEVSLKGNVIYMQSTAAIARGAIVKGVAATPGGCVTGVTGDVNKLGLALDKATASGQLIRVLLSCPVG